jgi:cytochrome c oxidase cbb3-type subunit III
MKESFERIKLKIVFSALASLPVIASMAEAATTPAAPAVTENSSLSPLWWLILGCMAVLVFAVMLLSGVLVNLAKLMVDKSKAAKAASLILLLLASSMAFSQEAQTAAKAATENKLPDWNIVMATTVMVTLLFVVLVLLLRIRSMLNELSDKKEQAAPIVVHLPKLFDSINASVAIEHEKDVLLDHNYDGIQELDNKLPPWWVYGFYATIIFAVVYLFYYHLGGGGPSSHDLYAQEMAEAKIAKDEYMRKNALNVDENTVKMADAAGIEDGKTIFTNNCAVCHGAQGQGIVGPNLTDDYWLHGGSINDVFKTIKNGWPAKGMKSWATDLTPVQIKDVASYVKSLHGTNPPNAKAPQGDLYSEAGAAKTDSTGNGNLKSDSTSTVSK